MRNIPTLVSLIALLATAAAILRMPGRSLPWPVFAYVFAQMAFTLLAWLGLQRVFDTGRAYFVFYAIAFSCVMSFAIVVTLRMVLVHPKPLAAFMVVGAMAQSAAIAAIVYWQLLKEYNGEVPDACVVAVVQGAVLAFCGAATLIATAARVEPEIWATAFALGSFWTALASLSWAYSLGIVRQRGMWLHLNDFLPAFFAIVAFTWLAFQLNGLQREGALQEIHQTVSVQAEV